MGYNESEAERQDNTSVPAPRLRTNISAALTLTTTFQRLDFAGTSTLNTNTFTMNGANPMVYWDATNKLFKFQAPADKNYDFNFNMKLASSSVLSVLSLALATIQLRYVVPSPTPIYFPLPDSDQCINIQQVGLIATDSATDNRIVYANALIRQYGLGLEMRISNTFLGTATATLSAADLIIFGR